ncbi:MAG: hypothetical protein AAF514_09145, partial [Verrucomicrobiota bacterium]
HVGNPCRFTDVPYEIDLRSNRLGGEFFLPEPLSKVVCCDLGQRLIREPESKEFAEQQGHSLRAGRKVLRFHVGFPICDSVLDADRGSELLSDDSGCLNHPFSGAFQNEAGFTPFANHNIKRDAARGVFCDLKDLKVSG